MQKIIFIVGPTGIGKTSLSIEMAKRFNAEIICMDSMQIYKGLDILSAKVTDEERQGIVHHAYDFLEPTATFSTEQYQKLARKLIDDITSRGKLPIFVGGTGLYANAVLYDFNFANAKPDAEYRQELQKLFDEKGSAYLHSMLKLVDPESAEIIHPNHATRIMRALEIYKQTGIKKSDNKQEQIPKYDYLMIGLKLDRAEIYARTDRRVDIMLKDGIIDEVRSLKQLGVNEQSQSYTAIGLKEVDQYLKGETTYDKMTEVLKQHNRNYAKRQITWFNKAKGIIWMSPKNKDEIAQKIQDFIGATR